MILLSGLGYLTNNAVTNMSNGKAGTDNTLFVKTQTGLQSGVAGSELSLVDKTSSTSQISVTHQLNVITGNGSTYVEYEVNDGSNSYNRAVKAGVVKSTLIELTVVHTFDFEIVV